ncbi:MAG: hypothetical protein EBE86_024705 [Hormoscilla sp. GUM202]|nr:hypothetical protein [Hormoscilla sp. GUM202]
MDPLIAATVALGTVVGTKVLEKTGEKVGDAVWDKGAQFLDSLKLVSPDTVRAIEQAPEQPLNYGKAVLEIESVAKANSEIARRMEELAAAGKANHHPKFDEVIEEIEAALNSQRSQVETFTNIIKDSEKIPIQQTMSGNQTQHNTF